MTMVAERAVSPTAASISNRLYGVSGVIPYRVILAQSGGAQTSTVIESATGDGAAELALQKYPGWKVANVSPAGDAGLVTDEIGE